MRSFILISYIAFSAVGYAQDLTLKRSGITDSTSWNTFITKDVPAKLIPNAFYAWIKAGEIHSSQGGFDGELLDGTFISRYTDNQLCTQGEFVMGLKDGVWKYWYQNGYLESVETWKMGVPHGKMETYDRKGNLLTRRKYHNGSDHGYQYDGLNEGDISHGEKDGLWIYRDQYGDTIRTETYRKGILDGPYQKLEKREVILEGQYKDGQKHGMWVDHRKSDTTYWGKGNEVTEDGNIVEATEGQNDAENVKGKSDSSSDQGKKPILKRWFGKKSNDDDETTENKESEKEEKKDKKRKSSKEESKQDSEGTTPH